MFRFFLFSFQIVFICSCGNKTVLEEVKLIPSYPSASGIEKLNNKYYIIGDDAKNLLILDSNLKAFDSISLFPFSEQRIINSFYWDLDLFLPTEIQVGLFIQ